MSPNIYLINKFVPGMLANREMNAELEQISREQFASELLSHDNLASFSDPRIAEELEDLLGIHLNQNRNRRFFQFKPEDYVVLVERSDRRGVLEYHFSRIKVKVKKQRRGLSGLSGLFATAS
ncbi:MAG TPA: hypothetical protein VFM18_03560 [Methanosarcina sp.]|nr:hypothetical protein [Methanosarcina sp.]